MKICINSCFLQFIPKMNILYSMICIHPPIAHTPMIEIYYIIEITSESTVEYINGVQRVDI